MDDYVGYFENPSGFVQIDSVLKNMRVLQFGSVITGYFSGPATINYPAQAVRPLVMFSSPVNYSLTAIIEHSSTIVASFDATETDMAANIVVDYIVLVPMLDTPLDTGLYVFELYNEAGALVFSAAENYVGIDSVQSFSTPIVGYTRVLPLPAVPYGKRYFSLTYEYLGNSAGVAELGVRLLPSGNLEVGPLGWQPDTMPGPPLASSIQIVSGYFQP